MALVIDGLLSAATLRRHCAPEDYAAAEELADEVTDVLLETGRAGGTVPGRPRRTAAVDWSSGHLGGGCGCQEERQTVLCRHVVAVGLAALEHAREHLELASPPPPPLSPVEQWLTSLEPPALRALTLELGALSEEGTRLLQTRSALATGATDAVEAELLDHVTSALRGGGFVDYRASFRVGREATAVLDELEGHLDGGRADLTLAPLLKALTRLRKITETADDSAGVLGDACQRAADLYARACREGHPDATKLARWLARFRETSPGWPDLELEAFAPAFDAKALGVYRKAVMAMDVAHQDDEHRSRFELNLMLLELADHDGDVDTAVEILGRGDFPQYGAMLERLDAADRRDEAMAVIDRAVDQQRLTLRQTGARRASSWVDPADVAFRYLEAGRPDDALAMLHSLFEREPGAASYQLLLGCAGRLGEAEGQRDWAMSQARLLGARAGHAALLVELLLFEGDLEGAWAVADEVGAGHAWPALAEATAQTDPARAADLYRPQLDALLQRADKRSYQHVASTLTTMRRLYAAAGSTDAFDDEIRELRLTYKRRPMMMTELDRDKLPR
ncbi:MAG: hypothetical protein M3Y71_05915 [Actinomycetota bacterium]|nr:hypothetical protein [Actinomycetota bacterium]